MKINGIFETNWALKEGVLTDLFKRYSAHIHGEKVDWKAMKTEFAKINAAMPGDTMNMPCKPYDIQNGVAIIPIEGVMMKNMDFWAWFFGGCSTVDISAQINDACNNREVNAIVLAFDTPGGMVSGLDGLVSTIAKCDKKIVSYIDGTMASAGVWVGMNADEVVAGSDTCMIGSIGIVTSHTDVSGAETMAGMKTTELAIPSGKRIASEYAPLTEAGKNSIMANITAIYDLFAADVSKNRNIPIDNITNLDGKMMLAGEAVAVGLCDKIMPMDELIQSLQGGVSAGQSGVSGAVAVAKNNNKTEVKAKMKEATIEQIKAENPALYNQIVAEGMKAEQARVAAIQAIPGAQYHKELIAQAVADPSMDEKTVLRAMAAENALMHNKVVKGLEEDRTPVTAAPISGSDAVATEGKSAKTYAQDTTGWTAEYNDKPELRAEFGSVEAYIAYQEAVVEGKIRKTGGK